MNVTKETITPKKAMQWLQRNIHNRPLSTKLANDYAKVMRAGRWKLNGETVKFNGNGDLIDGQHRLTACVEAGTPFESYVVRGLSHETFDTIDQGRKRTAGDVLARRGEKHYTMLAAACRIVFGITTLGKVDLGRAIRPDEIIDTINEHPDLRVCCEWVSQHRGERIVSMSLAAALLYLFGKTDPERASVFWNRVLTGEGLTRNMPEFYLRSRLIENGRAVSKLRGDVICALAIKAWNAAIKNAQCKQLKWDTEREEFPKIA